MSEQPFTREERIRRLRRLARYAERDGAADLAAIYRRMARDLAPAPAPRRAG
jgi:hypothetical protein